jgi:probable F420-dependent oxidoreductase
VTAPTDVPRYGITFPFDDLPLPEQRDVVASLPGLGYTDLWSAESNGADAFTPLALASQWAPELRLGTAVAPVYTRGPATLAMSAATLAAVAPGRFVLGVGSSSDTIVEKWNATSFDAPYGRVRDTVRFVREALTGAKVTREYETFAVDGFRLTAPPERQPPILVAALRSGMLRLAGREADGAIVNWLSADDVRTVAPHVHEGAAARDGDPRQPVEIAARIFVAPSEDLDTVRLVARYAIAAYLTVPAYHAFHVWLGREQLLAPMLAAWQGGDRKAALAAIPDALIDELIVHGSPEHCRERIQAYVEAGITTPILALLPVGVATTDAVEALAPR